MSSKSLGEIWNKAKNDPASGVTYQPPDGWKGVLRFKLCAGVGTNAKGTTWCRLMAEIVKSKDPSEKGQYVNIIPSYSEKHAFLVERFIQMFKDIGLSERKVLSLFSEGGDSDAESVTQAINGISVVAVAEYQDQTDKNGNNYINWTFTTRKGKESVVKPAVDEDEVEPEEEEETVESYDDTDTDDFDEDEDY